MDDQERSALRKLANIEQLNEAIAPSGIVRDCREIADAWRKNKRVVEQVIREIAKDEPRRAEMARDFIQDVALAIEDTDDSRESPSVRPRTPGL